MNCLKLKIVEKIMLLWSEVAFYPHC